MAELIDPAVKSAATLLAEVYVAARAQREKKADLSQYTSGAGNWLKGQAQQLRDGTRTTQFTDWLKANPVQNGALLGAGVGGLGGMALGAHSDRKKHPLATGLTGALAGAALGGGAGGIYQGIQGVKAIRDTPVPPPPTTHDNNKQPTVEKVYNLARSYVTDTPEAKGLSTGGIIGSALARNSGGADPWVAGGGLTGMATGAVLDHRREMSDQLRRATDGSKELLKGTNATPKPGGDTALPHSSLLAGAEKAELQQLQSRITGAKNPYGGLGLGSRYRMLEDARIGRSRAPVQRGFAGSRAAILPNRMVGTAVDNGRAAFPGRTPAQRMLGMAGWTAGGMVTPGLYAQGRNAWDHYWNDATGGAP